MLPWSSRHGVFEVGSSFMEQSAPGASRVGASEAPCLMSGSVSGRLQILVFSPFESGFC